jgi:hypothetical protein
VSESITTARRDDEGEPYISVSAASQRGKVGAPMVELVLKLLFQIAHDSFILVIVVVVIAFVLAIVSDMRG